MASTRTGVGQMVARGWWLIGLGIAAGVATAYVYCKRTTTLYAATAKIFLSDSSPHVTEGGSTMVQAGFLEAQMAAIRSLPVMERAAAEVDAKSMRSFRGAKDVPSALQAAVTVEPDLRAETIMLLTIETPDADEGARALNGLIKAYAEEAGSDRRASVEGELDVLTRNQADAVKEVAAAQAAVKSFRLRNPSLNLSAGQSTLDKQAEEVADAITKLQSDQETARSTVDEAEAALASPTATVAYAQAHPPALGSGAAPDAYAATITQLAEATARLQQDEAQFGSGYYRLADDRNLVDKVQARLPEAATARVQDRLLQARRSLKDGADRLAELNKKSDVLKAKIDDANAKSTDYAALDMTLKAKQAQQAELDKQIRDLRITEQVGSMTVKVIDAARPTPTPVWPKWNQSLAVGGVAGLVLGIAGAFLLAGVDSTLRSADDAVEELGLPVLGAIPHIRGGGKSGAGLKPSDRARAVHLAPATPAAEAYRTIRTALYFGVNSPAPRRTTGGGPRRVLITSPLPGDGKSTFASNLAIAMAQSGRRVVLVDADLRRPTQAGNHDMRPTSATLADVFAGRVHLSKLVRPTTVDKLFLLACGASPGPAELLTSPLFGKMLDSLNRACDVVVIDSPPVLPVADARILAVGCDATILVLRSGKSSRRTARQARDSLLSVGACLVGTVVNDVARAAKTYGGYGGVYGSVVEGRPAQAITPDFVAAAFRADELEPGPRDGSPDAIPATPLPDGVRTNGHVPEPAGM
jgi:capsular exopolysaccharide synthesis family protein